MLRMDLQDSWADKRDIIEERTKFPSVRERLDFFYFTNMQYLTLLGIGPVGGYRHQTSKYKDRIANFEVLCDKGKSTVKPTFDWEVREGLDTVGFKLIL